MVGLAELQARIAAEAEKEARRIVAEAQEKAAQIVSRAHAERKRLLSEAEEKGRREGAELLQRAATLAELETRQALIVVRTRLVEEAFQRAREQLSSLDDQTYRSLLKEILVAAAETGEEEVILSETDRRRLGPEFWAAVNTALAQRGKAGKLRPSSEARELIGGAVLRREEVEVDASFDSALRTLREALEPDVARLLFST